MAHKAILLMLSACLALLLPGCKDKDSQTSPDVDANQVKEQIAKAAEATGSYLTQQKQKMMGQATETYDRLKTETQQLITDLKESGRQNWQQLSSSLDNKLDAAQQKLDELKESGQEGLSDAKNAFDTAADELKDAYKKAKAEFQNSEEQK